MTASITFSGVKITSAALYRQYFRYGEAMSILSTNRNAFRRFLPSVFPQLALCDLFGLCLADGTPQSDAPVALLDTPEECVNLGGWIFKPEEGKECVTANVENLVAHIVSRYRNYLKSHDKPDAYDGCPEAAQMKECLQKTLAELTRDGKRQFSYQGASELYLYCLLCAQAGILPDESEENLRTLRERLDRLTPLSAQFFGDAAEVPVSAPTELPFYTGETPLRGEMGIVRLRNQGKVSVRVSLRGSVAYRIIPPGAYVYALCGDGMFLSFLPGVALVGETVLKLENGKLCSQFRNSLEYVETQVERPVCWAHSNEYGTFILDQRGNLDLENASPDTAPEKSAVMVTAYGTRYCILLADGETNAHPPHKNWQNLIEVFLGKNASIAIDRTRTPILQDGTALTGVRALDVCALDEHYACLSPDGAAYTDSGLSLPKLIQALSICPQGYLAADPDGVTLYGFDNQPRKHWEAKDVTEIVASERIAVWFSGSDRKLEIHRL